MATINRPAPVIEAPIRQNPVVDDSQSPPAAEVTPVEQVEVPATPNYWSIYTSTILAVSLVFLVGVGWPCAIFLDNYSYGFGLGAFCAIWGGPSFGVMAASARVSAWYEAHGEHM